MKAVEIFERDYDYVPASDRRITVRFLAGVTYLRVLEAAARRIELEGAGRIIEAPPPGAAGLFVDAGHAFRRR